MDFFFFVLLTAIMMIRPEELFPDLTGARLYLWTILLATATAWPKLTNILSAYELSRRSIAVCVLGFYSCLFISSATNGHWSDIGEEYCTDFFKVALFYFLLIAVIDTPERLRLFIGWLVLLVCGVALVAALHYYEVVYFPLLQPTLEEGYTDPDSGEFIVVRRALASGIFGDPNDLCLILTLGMLCSAYHALTTPAPSAKLFWCLPIVPLFFVLTLTGSRGGMIGLLAGFASLLYALLPLRVGIPLAIAGVAVLLGVSGGRSANITGGGTAHERLMLWADGLVMLTRYTVCIPFGMGPGWYIETHALLAHNAFISSYVELGLFGGGFFLVAFVSAVWLIDRLGRAATAPPWARAMFPPMLAIVVAQAGGCFSLSRHLVLPTYLVLGLATVYINLAGEPPPKHIVNSAWFRRAVVVMALGLVGLKLLTMILGALGI